MAGMSVIWKVPIGPEAVQQFNLPGGSQVVRVAWQRSEFGEGPMMWLRVDPTREIVLRKFLVVCTGDHFPSNGVYVGTFETARDFEVMHVIEVETPLARSMADLASAMEPV